MNTNMKLQNLADKITQGMYVLTTHGGGCVVDAVAQVSGEENPLVAVAVMNKNHTCELMEKNSIFALSVLGEKVEPEIIKTFGMTSMRDVNKFERVETVAADGVNVLPDSLGYMLLQKVDSIKNATHTLFIGRVTGGKLLSEGSPMSYNYYRTRKDELLKVQTELGKTAWVCTVCGYVYYGETLPDDYICPICGVDATNFEKQN